MALEAKRTHITYLADGEVREFPVPFAYSRTADIRLLHTSAAGVETAITSNFRVNVNEAGNTSVTFPVTGPPLPYGTRLTVYRDTPLTQIVRLLNTGAFHPQTLEIDGFDRLVMMIQEVAAEVDRAVKVAISLGIDPDELLARIFEAEVNSDAAAGRADAAVAECLRLLSIFPLPTADDAGSVLTAAVVGGSPQFVLRRLNTGGGGEGGGSGMADYAIPVRDASGKVTVSLEDLGHPEQLGLFNPVINLLSMSPYTFNIVSRSAEEFTVQIYRPGGVPGADIVEFIELGTFELGDGTELGMPGEGSDVTLLVSIPL